MRKIFTTLKSVVAASVIAAMTLAASCSYDDAPLTQRVDSIEKDLAALTERVAALEKRLGEEVEALTALINGKVVVTGVEKDGDATKVTLSDGSSFTVYPECTVVDTDTDTDTNTYVSIAEEDGVLYFAIYEMGEFKEWLTINGEKVPVYDGNTDDDVCDNPYQPEAPVAPQFKVEGENIMVSIDGGATWVESGLSAAAAGAQIFTGVVVNDNNTVTFTLADGSTFDVIIAELIEFNSTRAQSYVKAGETKEISFTVNDAVADINIMNQPLGWKATVEAVVAEEGDEPEAGVLAAGGTEFVLKVTAPSSDFVATGYAEKEGFIAVHFNTAAGACKVAKLQVNLAEITLDVDKAGNVTVTNTLVDSYLYSSWEGEQTITEFNNYYVAIMDIADYNEDLSQIYNQGWYEFTVPHVGGWINNFYYNVNSEYNTTDKGTYREGENEKWTFQATVEEIIDVLDWGGTLSYEGNSFMVVIVPTDPQSYSALLLDQALAAPFKQLSVKAEVVETTWNDAFLNATLRGANGYYFNINNKAELQSQIDNGWYAGYEAYYNDCIFYWQNYSSNFGSHYVAQDVAFENISFNELINYGEEYPYIYQLAPNSTYIVAILAEEDGKTEYSYEDLIIFEFTTADIVEATTPAEYTIEYNDQRTYTNIGVDITVPEDTAVAYTRWYEEQQMELDLLKADLIENGYDRTDFEYSYTFSTSTSADKAAAVRYLGLLIVNANGEYTLVQKELTSKDVAYNAATLAIDKVEFPGDGTAKVYFSGIEGLEIDYIHFYSSDVANTSGYYKNLTEEELADIAYGNNWLYRTANDNSNPVVIPYDVAYDTFEVGKTYKFALGVAFTDGTVSNCAYLEVENALPEGAFVPVRAEYDMKFETCGNNDSEYYVKVYNEAGDYAELICHCDLNTDFEDTVSGSYNVGGVSQSLTINSYQAPNDYNCAEGQKYIKFSATAADGTEINVDAQLAATEIDFM